MEILSGAGGLILDDYLIGKTANKTDEPIEFGGQGPLISPAAQRYEPLAMKCGGKRVRNTLGDRECFGCTYFYDQICLQGLKTLAKEEKTGLKKGYSDLGKALLGDLCLEILRGKEWNDLPEYIKYRYAGQDLREAEQDLRQWLKNAGFLGLLFVDTEFYKSCRDTQKKIANAVYSPLYVTARHECGACIHRFADKCSLLQTRIFSPGDTVEVQPVRNQIDAMVRLKKIPSRTADACKKIAESDPIKGLHLAVMAVKSRNMPEDMLPIDSPEPADAIEVKDLLRADEMVVSVDPATEYNNFIVDGADNGAAVDGYLRT